MYSCNTAHAVLQPETPHLNYPFTYKLVEADRIKRQCLVWVKAVGQVSSSPSPQHIHWSQNTSIQESALHAQRTMYPNPNHYSSVKHFACLPAKSKRTTYLHEQHYSYLYVNLKLRNQIHNADLRSKYRTNWCIPSTSLTSDNSFIPGILNSKAEEDDLGIFIPCKLPTVNTTIFLHHDMELS